ncbi:MarR family transcriptional regulator [Acidimicrobiaceae bacterium USS-CC1]|uniref:Manganese transport regulator n=1 Tax=Acidiferrimicrobium australe TaxID=2664430 RepID=A0ABW9QUP6_9ACTN|nr:MarR family transcriptional regulator [Acidiferrimicrobium australe]
MPERRPAGPTPSAVIEDYLRGIHAIEEVGGSPAATTDLARRLGVSVSAVSGMVRRLSAAGLVDHRRYGRLALTDEGRRAALGVVRRHRLIETFLVEVLGYGWDEVQDEAEVLEHAVSDRLLARMAELLGHPGRDPHGDPIPGPDGTVVAEATQPLSALPAGTACRLVRVLDAPGDLLRWLSDEGVGLGESLVVGSWDPGGTLPVRLREPGRILRLGPSAAARLQVTVADDAGPVPGPGRAGR